MLLIECPKDGPTLAWPDQIEALINTPLGPVARVRCVCGAVVTWHPATRRDADLDLPA